MQWRAADIWKQCLLQQAREGKVTSSCCKDLKQGLKILVCSAPILLWPAQINCWADPINLLECRRGQLIVMMGGEREEIETGVTKCETIVKRRQGPDDCSIFGQLAWTVAGIAWNLVRIASCLARITWWPGPSGSPRPPGPSGSFFRVLGTKIFVPIVVLTWSFCLLDVYTKIQ